MAQKQATSIDLKEIGITIPERVNPIYAEFHDFTVSLEEGKTGVPGLSFMVGLTQHLAIPSSGRIYWVIHSRLKGFKFFEVPVRQDELPARLEAFIQDFAPNAAPFQTFLIRLENNNEVSYLSRADVLR